MNATFTPLTLMPEEQKVIDFAREFYAQNGQVPAIRRICRECNISAPWFYRAFRNLEGFCERAGIKIDRETLVRIKGTRKATKRRTREKRRQLPRDSNPPAPPTVESQNIEMETESTFKKLQQGLKDKEAAQGSIRENARNFAEELKTLALTGHPDVNGPILEALGEVMPSVLFYKYDIAADIPDLLSANDVLREVKKERKKLRKQQIQLDGERQEIQGARELLKRDSDKASLLEYIERLEWQAKVNAKRFSEAYNAFQQFRMLFRELMPVIRRFPDCYKVFVQNMMENHDDVLKWLTSGGMRLNFESEGTPKLGYRT